MPSDSKESVLQRLHGIGVVAIVRVDSADSARKTIDALFAGGMRAVEITLTTPSALELIRELAAEKRDREFLIGAGTVRDEIQAAAVIDAGAQFVVAPTYNPAVVRYCNQRDVVVAPGALTPTEIETAWRGSADIVKIFPAQVVGPAFLNDIAGPMPGMRLMPTGGIDFENAASFIRAGAYAVGVGGAVVDKTLVAAGRFDEIQRLAHQFVEVVAAAKGTAIHH